MPKFRSRVVEVEAELCSILIQDAMHNWAALPAWFREAYERGGVVILNDGISCPTLNGPAMAKYEDWIVCGMNNDEIYPCTDEIFRKKYEVG